MAKQLGVFQKGRCSIFSRGVWHHYRDDWLAPWNTTGPCGGKSRKYATLRHYVEAHKPASICIYRTYALGDILMMLPVLRVFRRVMGITTPLSIVVQERFLRSFKQLNRFDPDFWFLPDRGLEAGYAADIRVDFNSILEIDHRGGPESDIHRVDLYRQAIGV